TPMWSNSTAGQILRAELARNCQVNVLAALDRREIDPFDVCVGALALGAEENGRNAGRGEHRRIGPERDADDLRLTGSTTDSSSDTSNGSRTKVVLTSPSSPSSTCRICSSTRAGVSPGTVRR